MARVSRKKSNSGIYHIMLRGVNRQNIFEDNDDRYRFLEVLRSFKEICKYELYGYCLMSNHIHILMQELDDSISVAIKRISASYVLWYNKKYDRVGHLFQERFKSEPIEDDRYFFTVLRYIHQNPIKAGIVNDILKTKWTSYFEYINGPDLVDTSIALELFSSNKDNAIDLYKKYMEEDNEDKCLDVEEKVVLNDEEILAYIKSLGVPDISTLQQMDCVSRDTIIRKIKRLDAVSLRQLSRVTGISKSVIGRV